LDCLEAKLPEYLLGELVFFVIGKKTRGKWATANGHYVCIYIYIYIYTGTWQEMSGVLEWHLHCT